MSSKSLLDEGNPVDDGVLAADGGQGETPILTGSAAASTGLRFAILMCICFLTFGSYWVFDTPGAIQKQLEEWFGPSYTEDDNALLYSIYSWPNTVLALCGGFIVDRITGVRKGALLFSTLIWIGQLVFCIAIQTKTFWLAVLGRFIFGLGGESLTVVQNTFVVRWFSGPYIALVFGLVLAFARVGSSVNFAVTPTLTEYGVPFSIWFGVGMCSLSLVACIILVILDYANSHYVEAATAASASLSDSDNNNTQQVQYKEDGSVVDSASAADNQPVGESLPTLKEIIQFPTQAWILFLICCFFYQGVITFYQVASKIMQESGINKFDEKTASLFLSIPSFVSIPASPSFGRLVDRKGYSVTFIIIASWVLVLCHCMFLGNAYSVFAIHPVIIMIILGLAYALGAAAMWPMLALIIPRKMVSTGYGTMTAIQNLGLAVFPLVISKIQRAPGIKDTTDQYGVPIVIFISCVTVACGLAVWLRIIDANASGILNASAEDRERIKKELEAAQENEENAGDRNLPTTPAASL